MALKTLSAAALALGLAVAAPAAAQETNAAFLGSIFTGSSIGGLVGAGVRGGVTNRDILSGRRGGGGLAGGVDTAIFQGGVGGSSDFLFPNGAGVDRVTFNSLRDFERPIRGGVAQRFNRARGHIASQLRKQGRTGINGGRFVIIGR